MPEPICFVIGPIGEPESAVRKRANQIVDHIIAPAAAECGYGEPLRADKISSPGLITVQIIQHVMEADMVVADLTGHNANVFYELAVRHLVRKPVVQLIEVGESIPFDVSPVRTIKVDHHDLDSAKAARLELARQMQAVSKDASLVDNPISSGIDLKALRESGKSTEVLLAQVIEGMGDIQARLAAIENFKLLATTIFGDGSILTMPPQATSYAKVLSGIGSRLIGVTDPLQIGTQMKGAGKSEST